MKQLLSIFLISIHSYIGIGYAQTTITKNQHPYVNLGEGYPQNYFQFPIMPDQQNFLSGNMGEIRGDHFHAGIDIKTNKKTGLPVYSAADGYVYRIKVSAWGYGNVLYIAHNADINQSTKGYFTVYAHLKKFDKSIADYVRHKQYQNESFHIELFPDSKKFPVKKGQQIGFSGNTGSSTGPHLHFEIRDNSEKALNPLYFGFEEIKDNIPPHIYKISLRTLNIRSRINGEFGRFEFMPITFRKSHQIPGETKIRQIREYIIKDAIYVNGSIGIAIETYDKVNGSRNKMGVNFIEVIANDTLLYQYHLEKINFYKTKNVKVQIDYNIAVRKKKKFQRCYLADGNTLKCYRIADSKGHKGNLTINDTLEHSILIRIYDSYNNISTINLTLKGKHSTIYPYFPLPPIPPPTLNQTTINHSIFENTLKVSAMSYANYNSPAQIFINNFKYELPVAYNNNKEVVYLWDLRKGLPDSMDLCGIKVYFTFAETIPSNTEYYFYDKQINLYVPQKALFDTLYLQIKSGNQLLQKSNNLTSSLSASQINILHDKIYEINNSVVPLYKNIYITLKPEREVFNKAKTSVYYLKRKNKYVYLGGNWQGNKIKFKTRICGKFVLLTDTIAPTVKLIIKNNHRINIKIGDNLSGIKSFIATINGKWLLMNYDHKRNLLWSERLYEKVPLEGEFKITVTDNVGNKSIYKTKIL